jgi:hypothetical protein
MKINSGFLFLLSALVICLLVVLAPDIAQADSYCSEIYSSASACSTCCHGGTCQAPANGGGGTWDATTGACSCFGCATSCQQECQAHDCQGAIGEARPCNCIGCPSSGNCPPPAATDQASCNNECQCQGRSGGTWEPNSKTCNCASDPNTSPSDSSSGGTVTIGPPYGGSGPQNINQLIDNITNWILGISGSIAVLFIIIAGLRYITAHGDSKQAEAAKVTLRNAIVGLVIIVLAYVIVTIILKVLTNT